MAMAMAQWQMLQNAAAANWHNAIMLLQQQRQCNARRPGAGGGANPACAMAALALAAAEMTAAAINK